MTPRRRRLVDAGSARCRPTTSVDYGYLVDDDPDPRPDPRSRRQPGGVHGLSRVRPRRRTTWTDAAWTGRQLAGSVIYELHIGTFTPDGTLDSAIERLDHLVDLGVDLVELLPVNAFNGTHNWGYDGVAWFAVHEHVRRPRRPTSASSTPATPPGLGVVQDVVHNHLGPSGNYLPLFGPYLQGRAQHLGRPGQPRRRGLGGGAPLHPRQRADVVRGLPRRRPAARRRARAAATPRRCTCSRRWRSRPPRCRPTCAARSP